MHYLIGKKITLLVIALMFVMGFFSVKVSSVYAEETAEPVATPSEVAIVAPSESTPVEVITVAETPAPVEAVTPVAEINNVSESVGTPIANTGVVTSEDTTRENDASLTTSDVAVVIEPTIINPVSDLVDNQNPSTANEVSSSSTPIEFPALEDTSSTTVDLIIADSNATSTEATTTETKDLENPIDISNPAPVEVSQPASEVSGAVTISEELNATTQTEIVPPANFTISPAEYSFTTSDVTPPPPPPSAESTTSAENSFSTLGTPPPPPPPPNTNTVSVENSFTTLVNTGSLSVSGEHNFNTLAGIVSLTISVENSFTTLNSTLVTTVSVENSFITLTNTLPVSVSGEHSFNTLAGVVLPTVSSENSFTTLDDTQPPRIEAVSAEKSFITSAPPMSFSAENSFTTLDNPPPPRIEVASSENSFTTLSEVVTPTISGENSFTTLSSPPPRVEVVSSENSFTTLDNPPPPRIEVVSAENSFTTLDDVHPPRIEIVSEEHSFTTLIAFETISDENSFTTLPSGGCVSNCGGGGGGGGGGGRTIIPTPFPIGYACYPWLTKFIKFGQPNDRNEVIRLQIFLRIFEHFDNLKVTGVYDRATYQAVKVFQARYSDNILNPWGITDSTGYVYITTTLAINKIFCNLDLTNNMDLRQKIEREYREASGASLEIIPIISFRSMASTTACVPAEVILNPVRQSYLLAAVGGLFNFIGGNFCWLINLLLILIILFLLWTILTFKDKEIVPSVTTEEEADKKELFNLEDLPVMDTMFLAKIAEAEDSSFEDKKQVPLLTDEDFAPQLILAEEEKPEIFDEEVIEPVPENQISLLADSEDPRNSDEEEIFESVVKNEER